MYDNLENIKSDSVNAVVFNLYQIKRLKLFFFLGGGHPVVRWIVRPWGENNPMKKPDRKVINIIGITEIIVRWIVMPWGENSPMKQPDRKVINIIRITRIIVRWIVRPRGDKSPTKNLIVR